MNNTNRIYIHSQTALPQEYKNLLKEGSSVFVRVLKDAGQGRYVASFGGGRFTIASKEALVPGSTFMAKVSIAGGKLNLVRTAASGQMSEAGSQKPVVQASSIMTPQVAELLASLGLPADNISKMLVQTLVGFGAKINLEKINKARNAALNFPGQEEEAAEAAMVLIDKGISPTIENIRDVMTGFGFNLGTGTYSFNENVKSDNPQIQELSQEIKNFFFTLTKGNKENSVPDGFLTVFNHLTSFQNEKERQSEKFTAKTHWIVVPFDFSFKRGENQLNESGVFRLFLDITKKNLKKMIINFKINGEIWTFVVSFKEQDIQKVQFSHVPEFDSDKSTLFKSKLKVYFENTPVDYESFQELKGFSSAGVLLPVAKGYV